MTKACVSVCSCVFLSVSLALYLGQMVLNTMFVVTSLYDDTLTHWFAPLIGLLLLPMVTVQIVSAILLLTTHGENMTSWRSARVAIVHILQLGLVWRHLSLFRKDSPPWQTKALSNLGLLHIIHTFTSMLPLLLIQCFLLLKYSFSDWLTVSTIGVTLAGSCWFLASFRHTNQNEASDTIVLTWPGTVFRFLWRSGEIISRTISLVVFASVYNYWIFLILGMHAASMLVCLCTAVLRAFDKPGASRAHHVTISVLIAYVYSFCFINFSSHNSTFRYTLFYVIMFFENTVLTVVWYLHVDGSEDGTKVSAIVFISACAFFIGVISLGIYYKFFHISASIDQDHTCDSGGCINCRLSLCSKHSMKLQRPFSAGWITQYQQALVRGNYYKNILHDSLLDSEWESVSLTLNSSGEHWQIRDTDLDTTVEADHKQYTSVQAKGTYAHKRFFDSDTDLTTASDSDTTSVGSGVYCEDWRKRSASVLSTMSDLGATSVTSSHRRLLTDSWDNLPSDFNNSAQNLRKVDVLNSLIRKDTDGGVSSDGFTTDHTLRSYKLPVTVLVGGRAASRRGGRACSMSSDSTDCTICAFIKQNPATPVPGRRHLQLPARIPEEPQNDVFTQSHRSEAGSCSSRHVHHGSKLKYKLDQQHRKKRHRMRGGGAHKRHELTAIDVSKLLDPRHDAVYKPPRADIEHASYIPTSGNSPTIPAIYITSASTDNLSKLYTNNRSHTTQNKHISQTVHRNTVNENTQLRFTHDKLKTKPNIQSADVGDTDINPYGQIFPTVKTNVQSEVPTMNVVNKPRVQTFHTGHSVLRTVKDTIETGKTIVPGGRTDGGPGQTVNELFTCESDSGDSALPRHTPLGSYRDGDDDGTSDSSLEMII